MDGDKIGGWCSTCEHVEVMLGDEPCSTCDFSPFIAHGVMPTMYHKRHVEPTYKVIRFFADSGARRTIKTGLPLSLAQEHCRNPETSSSTCTNAKGKRRTREHGPWFDGYTKDER